MMTKMEMQYMDAVIQMNRRQRNNEVDWEQRRYELAKAALFVAPALYHERDCQVCGKDSGRCCV